MNVILLEREDFVAANRVRVRGRRQQHARQVLHAAPGDTLRVGEVDGKLGSGRVLGLSDEVLEMEVTLDEAPPAPLPLTLVVALPRPPSLRKLLQQGTALGVKRFWLIHSRRVEKSYWQSTGLEDAALREQLLLGLEQSGDSVLPRVELRKRFKPFVEDQLPALTSAGPLFVADPDATTPCPRGVAGELTLIVGPEGGFIPFETGELRARGAEPVRIGERILRVETAVVALIARLCP